jgi:hypothetical protein
VTLLFLNNFFFPPTISSSFAPADNTMTISLISLYRSLKERLHLIVGDDASIMKYHSSQNCTDYPRNLANYTVICIFVAKKI